jgi:hypothetical protein
MTVSRLGFALALALGAVGCTHADAAEPTPTPEDSPAAVPAPPVGTCTIASSCVAIEIDALTSAPCCTPKSSCGYLLPEIDPVTLMFFPDAKDFQAQITKDDPNGRCAPESFFFGPQVGFNEERYEEEGFPDILIASSCASFHIAAFTLPGCCLPDNRCGLSTHSNAPMFEYWASDPTAPFAHPECVPAEVLNQQFRASKLVSVARVSGGGTCSYAEIAARQPEVL